MKKYPVQSRQTCFIRIMPVLAVLSIAFSADLTAKDAGVKKEATSMQSEVEKEISAQDLYVLKSLKMASTAIENKQYDDALSILEISDLILKYFAQNRQYTMSASLKQLWDELYIQMSAREYANCKEILKKIDKFTANDPKSNLVTFKISDLRAKYNILKRTCVEAYAQDLYKNCRDQFINVLSQKDATKAADDASKIRSTLNIALCMHYLGAKYGDGQELRKAIARGNQDFYNKVLAIQKQCSKVVNYKDFVDKTSLETHDPAYNDNQKQIHKLYRQGETLYRKRKFTEARDKMEQILVLDPYNDKAIQMLTRIYRKLYIIADMRVYNDLLQEQALIEWRWVESIPPKDAEQEKAPREYVGTDSSLSKKVKNIIIDSISFEQYTVREAIQELKTKSQQHDPDGTGVNFALKDAKSGASLFDKEISFSLEKIPLQDAIRYLCLISGLGFRIDDKDQMIFIGNPADIAEGVTFENCEFGIRRVTVDRMINAKTNTVDDSSKKSDDKEFSIDNAFEDDKVEDTFKSGAGAKSIEIPDYSSRLKQYLIHLGFDFPEGTAIGYDINSSRITLKHMPEVNSKIKSLLVEIDIERPLVLMEAKMMEISMTDLEELGFDWTLTHQNTNERWSFAVGSPVRKPLNASSSVLINNMNILPNFGGDNVWNLFLTVYALDQTSRAEVLSTPKIIASDGTPGVIKMVREMYFPDDWDEPEIGTSCGSSVTLEPSVPNFGEKTDVGIIFKATPQVSTNNYTIDLNFQPEVIDLVGWSDYSYDIVFGKFGSPASGQVDTNTGGTTGSIRATLKMPELSRRSVVTNVKVFDGQTVMVGGMLVDHQSHRDDQWPILGDIPLLGRLFTMDSFSGKKHNLLISVTSRLISGNGSPVNPNPAPGLPDFRR